MVRPRWHDVIIVGALVALVAVGVWALWWDDVRVFLHLGPAKSGSGAPVEKPPVEPTFSPRT